MGWSNTSYFTMSGDYTSNSMFIGKPFERLGPRKLLMREEIWLSGTRPALVDVTKGWQRRNISVLDSNLDLLCFAGQSRRGPARWDEAKGFVGDELVDGAIWVWRQCPRERRAATCAGSESRRPA